MRDLNFVLRSEIFVGSDGQLWVLHLILSCTPVCTTWQPFGPALLMDSPLLSYIDMRYASFLLTQLTVGEARNLDPRYTTADSIALVRDASENLVSQSHRAHILIEEQGALARASEPTVAESVNSSGAGADQDEEMVIKRTITIDRFFLSTYLAAQP